VLFFFSHYVSTGLQWKKCIVKTFSCKIYTSSQIYGIIFRFVNLPVDIIVYI